MILLLKVEKLSMTPEDIKIQIDRDLYDQAIPKKDDVQINLPWRLTCKIAVVAYMRNRTMDDIVSASLKDWMI